MVSQQLALQEFFARNKTLGQTARERAANVAMLYYLGRQYDGRAEWNDKSQPLRKRKPAIQVPLYREAIDSLLRFVWGGHRHPSFAVCATREGEADDKTTDDEIGPRLDPEEAEALTRFARAMVKQGRLDRGIVEASRQALITTSAALILGTQGGYLRTHCEEGKHCTPTWDPKNPNAVSKLEVVYQHEREEPSALGGTRMVRYWYRRVIDETTDTVYNEVPVRPGVAPEWTVDKEKSVDHRLGFCPVVWVRTLPDSTDAVDGCPVIDPVLYPLLEDVDRTLSQRSRAVSYGCDPQLVRTGMHEGEKTSLAKDPGSAWDLPKEADAKFIEIAGTGAQRATEHADDLTARFLEAVSVVKADPKTTVGNLSGNVLELLHAPMLALADDLRADLGEDAYCRLINLALRLCCCIVARGEDVWIPGVGQAAALLTQAQLRGVWLDVPVDIQWPAHFPPSADDVNKAVDAANKAKQGGLISKHTATRSVAPIFGIEDLDAEHEMIEREEAEQAEYGPLASLTPPANKKPDDEEENASVVEMEAEPASPSEGA